MPERARLASRRLKALLRQFPAVAILGARQVGKATLARNALPGFAVPDLEDPATCGASRRILPSRSDHSAAWSSTKHSAFRR
jgi:hypothetical protein